MIVLLPRRQIGLVVYEGWNLLSCPGCGRVKPLQIPTSILYVCMVARKPNQEAPYGTPFIGPNLYYITIIFGCSHFPNNLDFSISIIFIIIITFTHTCLHAWSLGHCPPRHTRRKEPKWSGWVRSTHPLFTLTTHTNKLWEEKIHLKSSTSFVWWINVFITLLLLMLLLSSYERIDSNKLIPINDYSKIHHCKWR